MSNCSSFLDFFEYEMETVRILSKYLYPLTKVVTCNGQNEIELDDLDTSFMDDNIDIFNNCFNDFGIENPDCSELCKKKNIFSYEFRGNLNKVIKQLLKIWIKRLANVELEEFYTKTLD